MNRDDSDLSSLADEDDYQGDNGSEMDDDDDQDVTLDFSTSTQLGIHTDFTIQFHLIFRRLSIANTLLHGLLKKPSPTPSLDKEIKMMRYLQNAEFHIKQLVTMKLGTCLKCLHTTLEQHEAIGNGPCHFEPKSYEEDDT
ncbi:hypothetical protein TNCV_848221 [Trichonephila clavipes]|uniref:Uncharacterized protein n=1 Tax=Trichonephila clavipes TaxID=2585209 RepID=A0A8X6RH83_TRICX|nr:hypothetical protein TNCV_848221 [Trichonephila clavipes]